MDRIIICIALALTGSLLGCDEGRSDTAATEAEEPSAPVAPPLAEAPPAAAHAAPPAAAHAAPGQGGQDVIRGTVTETMNSAGYTYLLIDSGSGPVWAAASEMTVAVGDQVEVAGGSMMANFTSRTLDRTFEQILFTSNARVLGANAGDAPPAAAHPGGDAPALPPGHP